MIVVISIDTLTLHIAIAFKKSVVAFFGSTCPQEIDLYNRGYKIVPDIDCVPCYKNKCDRESTYMKKIDLNNMIKAAKAL